MYPFLVFDGKRPAIPSIRMAGLDLNIAQDITIFGTKKNVVIRKILWQ